MKEKCLQIAEKVRGHDGKLAIDVDFWRVVLEERMDNLLVDVAQKATEKLQYVEDSLNMLF